MKKKKIDNNSKFLFMMSGFFVLLFAMIFVSTEFGKVTYSAYDCSTTESYLSGYCCTTTKANEEYYSTSLYASDTAAMNACYTYKNATIGSTINDCEVVDKTGLYRYNSELYSSEDDVWNRCNNNGDTECDYTSGVTGYSYKLNGNFWYITDCRRANTSNPSIDNFKLDTTSLTFNWGNAVPATLSASGGSGSYAFSAPTCTGFTVTSAGVLSVDSSTMAGTYNCRVFVEDNRSGVSINGVINITVRGYNYCKVNSQHEYQWYTNQKYTTVGVINKTQSECNGCEAGYYRNEGVCTPCTKCDGGACTCDNSKNGKYTKEFAQQKASECGGTAEPGEFEPCYKVTCPPQENTCVAANKEYQTPEERDVEAAKCRYGNRKWQAANGCYKYACEDAPADPSSGSSSSSSKSSSSSSSSSVKPSSKSSNITVNPPTGPGLIIIVSMLSVIMVAYSVWYFKKNQE